MRSRRFFQTVADKLCVNRDQIGGLRHRRSTHRRPLFLGGSVDARHTQASLPHECRHLPSMMRLMSDQCEKRVTARPGLSVHTVGLEKALVLPIGATSFATDFAALS